MDEAVAGHKLALLRNIIREPRKQSEARRRQEREHEAADGAQQQQLPRIGHLRLEQKDNAGGHQAKDDEQPAAVPVDAEARDQSRIEHVLDGGAGESSEEQHRQSEVAHEGVQRAGRFASQDPPAARQVSDEDDGEDGERDVQ